MRIDSVTLVESSKQYVISYVRDLGLVTFSLVKGYPNQNTRTTHHLASFNLKEYSIAEIANFVFCTCTSREPEQKELDEWKLAIGEMVYGLRNV